MGLLALKKKLMLHLNQDHQVVSGIIKLEHQKCSSELKQAQMEGWDEAIGAPDLGRAPVQGGSKLFSSDYGLSPCPMESLLVSFQ